MKPTKGMINILTGGAKELLDIGIYMSKMVASFLARKSHGTSSIPICNTESWIRQSITYLRLGSILSKLPWQPLKLTITRESSEPGDSGFYEDWASLRTKSVS